MKPEDFVEEVEQREGLVMLDVRTPAESAIFTATLPGSLSIPLNELFVPANLAFSLQRVPSTQ